MSNPFSFFFLDWLTKSVKIKKKFAIALSLIQGSKFWRNEVVVVIVSFKMALSIV